MMDEVVCIDTFAEVQKGDIHSIVAIDDLKNFNYICVEVYTF